MNAPSETETEHNDRLAGVALAAASLLSIFAMAHHPSGAGGHSGLAQLVHGTMIVVILVSFAAYVRLAARRGLSRFSTVTALVFYGAASIANMFAATLNGFVAPALAGRVSQDILAFTWAFNQALAYGAVYATSVAFLIWGVDLIRDRGVARILGAVGVAAAIAAIALLASGALAMNVAGAFTVYALQSAFGVLAGAYLMRAKG